jgi:hypothetical protein
VAGLVGLPAAKQGTSVLLTGVRSPLARRLAQPPVFAMSSTRLPFHRNFTVVPKPIPLEYVNATASTVHCELFAEIKHHRPGGGVRTTLDLPRGVHRTLKRLAVDENTSLQALLVAAILQNYFLSRLDVFMERHMRIKMRTHMASQIDVYIYRGIDAIGPHSCGRFCAVTKREITIAEFAANLILTA